MLELITTFSFGAFSTLSWRTTSPWLFILASRSSDILQHEMVLLLLMLSRLNVTKQKSEHVFESFFSSSLRSNGRWRNSCTRARSKCQRVRQNWYTYIMVFGKNDLRIKWNSLKRSFWRSRLEAFSQTWKRKRKIFFRCFMALFQNHSEKGRNTKNRPKKPGKSGKKRNLLSLKLSKG